jgi:phospholipid/cholesterol/gamma-HCH transport system permease protein
MNGIAVNVGGKMLTLLRELGGGWLLLMQTLKELRTRPLYMKLVTDQIYQIGIRSNVLILITAASTGMVMALQFGLGLEKFGGKLYVPKIVSLSIVREIGPVFCSLMLAARVGAGIASEIGSMVVTQQIDAIRALGTSPIKKIVIPRMLATLITLPLLTAFGNAIGIMGGLIVGVHELGLDPAFYYKKVFETVVMMDYMAGMIKTIFFAFMISLTACYFGMNVTGGTKGVGTATTKAVVGASISILVSDFFLTKLFFILFGS